MRTLFSTDPYPRRNRLRIWQEMLSDHFVPLQLKSLSDKPFEGKIESTSVGDLVISRVSLDAMRSDQTMSAIRRHDKGDVLSMIFPLTGTLATTQDERESLQNFDDFVILDNNRPSTTITQADTSVGLLIECSRKKLEHLLGPARQYSSLTVAARTGGGSLAATFFRELVDVQGSLDPATLSRMAAIGIDLIVASIAGRLAREMPGGVQGNVTVQRAKSHVEVNLGDPDLDPARVAAAVGISLRRLQELFRERNRNIADWIWERRLDKASASLVDPCRQHFTIGMIAYSFGFINQAHFSTRFKARFGMTPREFRIRGLESGVDAMRPMTPRSLSIAPESI